MISFQQVFIEGITILMIVFLLLWLLFRIRAKVTEPYNKIVARTTQLRRLQVSTSYFIEDCNVSLFCINESSKQAHI